MRLIDRVAHHNRWRRRHPIEKLVLALGMLILDLVLPPYPAGPIIAAIMLAAAIGGAGVPAVAYLRLLLAPVGFVLAGAAAVMVGVAGEPGLGWHFVLLPSGRIIALKLVLRALTAIASLNFLILTTPVENLLPLFRRWRVPGAVVDLIMVTYRFLFVFSDTLEAMRTAQDIRLGYSGWRRTYRSLAMLTAAFLGRVLDRARRLEMGLAARGYRGDLPVLVDEGRPSWPVMGGILALQLATAFLSLHLSR